MDKQIQQEALKLVQELANQLGVAGKHVWATLVRQAAMEGIAWGIFAGVFFLLALMALAFFAWAFVTSVKREDGDGFHVGLIGAGVALAVAFITGGEVVSNGLKVANPEYYALKNLADMAKPAAKSD